MLNNINVTYRSGHRRYWWASRSPVCPSVGSWADASWCHSPLLHRQERWPVPDTERETVLLQVVHLFVISRMCSFFCAPWKHCMKSWTGPTLPPSVLFVFMLFRRFLELDLRVIFLSLFYIVMLKHVTLFMRHLCVFPWLVLVYIFCHLGACLT